MYSHCENTDKKQLFKNCFDQRASQSPTQEDRTAFVGQKKSRSRITPLSKRRLLLQAPNHLERRTFRCSHVHSGKGIKDRLSLRTRQAISAACRLLGKLLLPENLSPTSDLKCLEYGLGVGPVNLPASLAMGHPCVALLLSKYISPSQISSPRVFLLVTHFNSSFYGF